MPLIKRLNTILEEKNMIKIKIIARGAKWNSVTQKKYTDAELRCQNLYFEDTINVSQKYNKTDIILKYEEKYSCLSGWTFEIIELV